MKLYGLPEGKSQYHPIKPPFSYGFPMGFLWFSQELVRLHRGSLLLHGTLGSVNPGQFHSDLDDGVFLLMHMALAHNYSTNDPQEWSYLVGNHLFEVSIILSHTQYNEE